MTASGEQSDVPGHSPRRAYWLLICGAAAGVILTATGVLRAPTARRPEPTEAAPPEKSPKPLPADAIARVNGRVIRLEDFQQLLAQEVAGGMVPDAAAKQQLVERMIDEELRIQRAIALQLHLTDSRVRMDLASVIAEAVTAGVGQEALDEATLRAYFEKRRDYFQQRGPLRVRQIWVGIVAGNIGDAYNRARAAAKMLREKQTFAVVREVCGTSEARPIPDQLLRAHELAAYLGGMALNVTLGLQAGEVSDPIRTVDGFHVLQVLERRSHETVSFDESRLDVEADYWSERAQAALDASAMELRQGADIQKAAAF